MRLVVTNGSCQYNFGLLDIAVACKTGTSQVEKIINGNKKIVPIKPIIKSNILFVTLYMNFIFLPLFPAKQPGTVWSTVSGAFPVLLADLLQKAGEAWTPLLLCF